MVCNHNRTETAIYGHSSVPNVSRPKAKQLKELSTVLHTSQTSLVRAKVVSQGTCVKTSETDRWAVPWGDLRSSGVTAACPQIPSTLPIPTPPNTNSRCLCPDPPLQTHLLWNLYLGSHFECRCFWEMYLSTDWLSSHCEWARHQLDAAERDSNW